MKKLFLFFTIVFFTACDSEERIVDNFEEAFNFFIVNENQPGKLSLIEGPGGATIRDDVLSAINSEGNAGKIERVEIFRDQIYVFAPEANKIYILGLESFDVRKTIDFSEQGWQPSDICFANATDAYIVNSNSNIVHLLDITNNELAREIESGPAPFAISNSGNQIYALNRGDNTASLIDSRTHKLVKSIPVGDAPTFIEVTKDGKYAAIVSIGNGRLGAEPKSPARLTIIDVATGSVYHDTEISNSLTNPLEVVIAGLAVPDSRFVYIATGEFLLRYDIIAKGEPQIFRRDNYDSFAYNYKRHEFTGIQMINGNKKAVVSNADTGTPVYQVDIPGGVYNIFPY